MKGNGSKIGNSGKRPVLIVIQIAKNTILIARKLGIWPEPLKLYRHLSKSGGGLMFRIPNDLEKQLKLNENKEIAITKVGNKIVIETEV